MKKLGFFNKVALFINWIVAILLIISFILPYVPPKSFPLISVLSLTVSPLIVTNILFLLFWLLQVRRQVILPLVILIIAFFRFSAFYNISTDLDAADYTQTLSVVSFNVRLFNAYEKKQDKDIAGIISELIQQENPDIICVQEYYEPNVADFSSFPYKYTPVNEGRSKLRHAIFSKYKLINSGNFNFDYTTNNVLYSDVIKGSDTIRLYNLHLQSLNIIPEAVIQEDDKERVTRNITKAFKLQQDQVLQLLEHKKNTKHPVLICGDFNNTPFSYTYQKLKDGMKDAFVKRGNGLGTTFLFDKYPMRIDFILADPKFDVLTFSVPKKTFSDHYPISTVLGWN